MDDTSFLDCDYIEYVDNAYVIQTRRVLLDFLTDILDIISGAPLPNVGAGFYSFALWIMKRPEFDLSLVKIDQKKNKFSCTSECLSLYNEYKELLERTLSLVTGNISSAIKQSRTSPQTFILDDDIPESDTSTDGAKKKKIKKPKGAKYIDDDDDDGEESEEVIVESAKSPEDPEKDKAKKKKPKRKKSVDCTETEHKKKSSKKSKRKYSDPDPYPKEKKEDKEDKEDKKEGQHDEEAGLRSVSPLRSPSPSSTRSKDFMPEKSPIAYMPPLFATFAVKFLSFAYFRLPCK